MPTARLHCLPVPRIANERKMNRAPTRSSPLATTPSNRRRGGGFPPPDAPSPLAMRDDVGALPRILGEDCESGGTGSLSSRDRGAAVRAPRAVRVCDRGRAAGRLGYVRWRGSFRAGTMRSPLLDAFLSRGTAGAVMIGSRRPVSDVPRAGRMRLHSRRRPLIACLCGVCEQALHTVSRETSTATRRSGARDQHPRHASHGVGRLCAGGEFYTPTCSRADLNNG